ncbi:MAG TPA: OmpA family protein [Telmatospirillum sp.]|nr:OmpA family protein [Telmatospirillum sp.]
MKFSRFLASMALPMMMAGCASFPGTTFQLEELEKTVPSGSPFTQALAFEYKALAASERAQYSWFNSQHFARKGLAAAHGASVSPEDLADWSFADEQAAQDLAAARVRLITVLGGAAPSRAPALTATAQVKFDCWVDQQDKDWKKEDISLCRKDFLAAMDALEVQAKPAAAATPAATATKPAKPDNFQLFFDFNQAGLTPEAARIVGSLASAAKAAGYPKLTITGYTDLTGSASYNARLSLKRAEAVRKALMAAGVPADKLVTEGRGKADPLVTTADGVREPQNRRAVIRFDN